ncbi:D-inositol-3-phosphate glycosyltransferase [Aquamicrobium terrae]
MAEQGEAGPGRRPRIAIVVRRFGAQFGGLEAYAEHLAGALQEACDFHVFCQEWGSDLPIAHTLVPRIRHLPSWLNLLQFTLACRKRVRGFDLVHSHENSWLGEVQTVHLMPARYSLFHQRRRSRLAIWTSPRLAAYLAMEAMRYRPLPRRAVVPVSPLTLAQVEAAYPHHPPMTVIPPGVRMPERRTGRAEARATLGLPQDRRYALLVAHDPARKGLDAVLDAMARLDGAVDLIVVGGDAGTQRDVDRAAVRAAQSDRVHVWPRQRDLAPFYAAADFCVFATSGDTFGMVPLEAMAHGLPVVMSSGRYCGFAHYVTPGVDALVLDDPADAGALAGAMGGLLAEPELRERLAGNGRKLAMAMGWDSVAARYLELYRRLLAG